LRKVSLQNNSKKEQCRVYDLLNVNNTNRFLVKSKNGYLISHNCIQSSGHQCLVIQIGILAELLAEREIPWLPIIIDFHDESLIQVPQGREEETIECFHESFVKLNEFLNGVVKLKGNPMTVETLADAKCED
jgi:hypothetical protein